MPQGEYPSQILSCISCVVDGAAGNYTKTFDLVVQFCDQPTCSGSFLFTEWFFNTDYYVVSSTSLVCLCFVLVSLEADGKVLVVNDKSERHPYFMKLQALSIQPHGLVLPMLVPQVLYTAVARVEVGVAKAGVVVVQAEAYAARVKVVVTLNFLLPASLCHQRPHPNQESCCCCRRS